MRIESSSLQFTSSHQAQSRYQRNEQLHVSLPDRSTGHMTELSYSSQKSVETAQLMTYNELRSQAGNPALAVKADRLSAQVEAANERNQTAANDASAGISHSAEDGDILVLSAEDRLRISLIQSLIRNLTGKDIEFSIIDLRLPKQSTVEAQPVQPTQPVTATIQPLEVPVQASLDYQVSESFYQQEQTAFQATGQVTSTDGKQIQIDISVNMSRELLQHREFSLQLGGALKDPLVISFDGKAAELSQERFEFDLTLDGQQELIPKLAGNAAFLALDRNGDAHINDGSELFGATTGDGFAELAEHDDDGNGWIDENDAIFEHLQLWLKPGEGNSQQLISLKDAGLGAIYLGNADTPFTLNGSLGEERLGVIRSSGIYLSEQGKAGLIQQVDLSV
ncbi:hypothetical protein [Nitrincola iocasae]|uniref:Calx-beta domain-containing protein n=1 Tax=Nitrincola iocasae TaxID=2614693 RepID=A0A5J6LFU4_9GAMM|nr:hypothetical protein [Nitrincola iocasae]QEW07434.1 hypothetical protein F5I99_13550 [Nitrincola iocasae]